MKRRKKRPHPSVWVFLGLVVVSCIVFFFRHRKHAVPQPKGKPHVHVYPARIARRFMRITEEAGGDDVWVRSAAPAKPLALRAADSFEALVVGRAYDKVVSAIQRDAREEQLITRVDTTSLPDGLRLSEAGVYAGRELVCRWSLREVPQIARVAIVMDDLGQNLAAARALLRMRSPLTFSVMPRLPDSRETAEEAHRAGIEVMLHLPMQPWADSAPGVSHNEIRVGMKGGEVSRVVAADLASVPFVAGVNNHMGSRATSDGKLMAEVMDALAERHLYFVDSRTAPNSVALDAARHLGIPSFYRSVFLDDTRTVPYTLQQLQRLCRAAQRRGAALAIGHPYPTTLAALAQFLPALERQDIQLVSVSRLVRLPEVSRLSPPRPNPAPAM